MRAAQVVLNFSMRDVPEICSVSTNTIRSSYAFLFCSLERLFINGYNSYSVNKAILNDAIMHNPL